MTQDTVSERTTTLTSTENRLSKILAVVLNAAMKLECHHHLHAEPHERTDVWYGYANADNERTVKTRLGMIELSVRQVRGSDEPFRPVSFDAAMASEKALRIALAEKTIQAVTPRRVKDVLESLSAFHVSNMEVSPGAKERGSVLHSWRKRRNCHYVVQSALCPLV